MRYAALLASAFILGALGLASGAAAQTSTAVKAAPVPATEADIKAGASVRDDKGIEVAKVVEMQGSNVVVDTGQTKIGVPLGLLAKDHDGLMLTITADQFNGAIAKAHARSEAAKAAEQTPQQTAPPKH